MVERVSALADHHRPGRFGADGTPGVTLSEVPGLVLHQIAGWPDTLSTVGHEAAEAAGAEAAPGPCHATLGERGALLRIAPLKWWLLSVAAPALAPEEGATLDLSHSRTHLRIAGPQAVDLLIRHLPLDLRPSAFPVGRVGSSAFHHVGVTLWRSEAGFELFLPRGFAASLWDMLLESAAQFGAEVA